MTRMKSFWMISFLVVVWGISWPNNKLALAYTPPLEIYSKLAINDALQEYNEVIIKLSFKMRDDMLRANRIEDLLYNRFLTNDFAEESEGMSNG